MQVAEAKDAELARVLDSNAGLREEVATLRAMQVLSPCLASFCYPAQAHRVILAEPNPHMLLA